LSRAVPSFRKRKKKGEIDRPLNSGDARLFFRDFDGLKKNKTRRTMKEISTCRHFLQDNAGLVALHARAEQLKSSRIRVEQVDRDEMPDKRKIKRNRHLTSLSSFF
jgi:hypothetical protein